MAYWQLYYYDAHRDKRWAYVASSLSQPALIARLRADKRVYDIYQLTEITPQDVDRDGMLKYGNDWWTIEFSFV